MINKKSKIILYLQILFTLLTFLGAGYVILKRGAVSPYFAVAPMAFAIIFSGIYVTLVKPKKK